MKTDLNTWSDLKVERIRSENDTMRGPDLIGSIDTIDPYHMRPHEVGIDRRGTCIQKGEDF